MYYRIFTKNFCACMHTALLIFHFLVSLLGIHVYLYWYEQYEKSCFLFKVKVCTYITIHFSVSPTKVGTKLCLYVSICLLKSFLVYLWMYMFHYDENKKQFIPNYRLITVVSTLRWKSHQIWLHWLCNLLL